MNTRIYKSCAVPLCSSTTLTTPHKLFVYVPSEKERRKLWLRLAGLTMAPCKTIYFCEDHFDMLNDMSNFMEYHIRGSVSRIRMNAGCLPSKFDCQANTKNVSDMSRSSIDNRQRKSLIEDCIENKEQNQDLVDQRCDEDSEVPIGCSAGSDESKNYKDTMSSIKQLTTPSKPKSNLSAKTRNAKRLPRIRSQKLEKERESRLNALRASTSKPTQYKLKTSKMMEVIDLDCDDATGINEIQSGANTKESNVSLISSCVSEINNETASQEKTEDKQTNLTPGASSSLDLDKFKRRLIRVIARSLVIEKKPEITFWQELKKVTSCDCQLLWTRMRAVTIKKLKRLLAVEDKAQNITKIARLSVTDWLLIDLVLVHEKVDVIGQDDEDDNKDKEEPKTLEYIFKLVLKHNTESLSGDKLTEAWFNAANDYNKCGRFCSPMLLQRRWYQLKELVWYNFYNFWFSYRGDPRNLHSAGRFKPTTLQTEIIKHFNKIVTEQFPTWEELIEQKKVVLLEDFERYELALKKGTNTGQENEPDLVVIEPHVDTIDLRLEPDSDSDNAFDTNEASKTTDNLKINLSIIKNETIDEISDEDDLSVLEAVDIPCDFLKPSNVTINEDIEKDDTKDDNNTKITTISNNDEEITTISNSDEVVSDSDEEVIDNDDEDAVILNDSNDTTTSLETKHVFKEHADDSKNSVEFKQRIILDVDVNKSHEKSCNYVNSAGNSYHHNIVSQKITYVGDINIEPVQNHQNKEERVIQDIEEITKSHEDMTDITNVQGLITNLISDIKKESSNLPEKQNTNILYDVTSNLGVYMNGLELEDDGIEYFEEDDDDDVTEIIDNTGNNVEEDCTTNKKDPPKIDLKLLLQTVVYTKRLNDMDVFRFIDYKSVKDARIINEAIIESIPLHKKSFKMEDISESESTYKSDMSDAGVSNDDECQKRINYKSWHFKKPKISTYNPIQLCKNPDFNTRLKRLTAGFFSSERNRRLLKECKPLTIDIYKSFEMKPVNNSLMRDGFPSQTIKKDIIEPTPGSEVPTLLPTESLISTEEYSSKQCIPKVCDISDQNNEVDPQIVGRNRIISLPDINQIRRANEKLLIAEVTPIQISSTSCKPPVEILQHTANIESIKEQDCQNKNNKKIQNIEKSLPPNNDIINVDIPKDSIAQKSYNILMLEPEERMELEIETSKECETSGLNVKKRKRKKNLKNLKKPPVKPTKNIREFVQKGIPTDRLLALDTIERILGICQNNVDPTKLAEMQIKNKTQKLRKKFLNKTNSCKQKRKNDMETGDVQDISIENNEDIVAKEIPLEVKDNKSIDSTPIVAGGNSIKIMNELTNNNNEKKRRKRKDKKKLPRTIYCCWAREKTVSLSKPHQRLLSAHMCSLPLCSCCCRDDYVKALRKLHPRQDSLSGLPQILISTAVNNGSSEKEQSCEPPKIIMVEKVSQATNTDDNPEYTQNLLEASKLPFDADANKYLPEQNFFQQKSYLSSETSTQTLDKVSQVPQIQSKDMYVDIISGLNPIITSVQSLSHTQPVVLEDVEETNDNIAKTPLPVKCKTNVLYSVGPCYLTSPKEKDTNVPEPLSQLTVVVPDSKAYLLNKKLHKTPNPITLGKNKILLCSKRPKDKTEKQINEQIPPQLVMLNNNCQPLLEDVNMMLPPSQSTHTVNPRLNLDSQKLKSISTTNSILEQKNTNSISNPIVASCDLNVNVNNENPNVDSAKATEQIKDLRSDETSEGTTLSKSDTLTQSKFAGDINIQCREKITENPELTRTVVTDTIISTSKLKTIENTKTSNKIESIPHKSTDALTKKTILSDLMEMSGISLEDTSVNSESTELAGHRVGIAINNTSDIEISNISFNPDHLNTANALNIANGDQFGSLSSDLNVVSSLYDLKQACDKNKQFYKLDIESGQIIPINVSIKKHTKPKHKPIPPNTVIDLTDDGEKEKDLTSDPRPDEQSEVARPLKLYKAVHPTLLKGSGISILRNPVTSKEVSLQKKRFTLKQILDRKRKEQNKKVDIQSNKIVMKCDENAKKPSTINSDSDDEPLAFKAKRKKNDDDDNNDINTKDKSQDENRSEVAESLGASASATNTNEPEVNIASVNPVLEPVVFNDSSDEDCILGV